MQFDRKSKLVTDMQAHKKSLSVKKINENSKHLLSKPNIRKNSIQKNTQSFSTMFSHNNLSKSTQKFSKKLKINK